MAESRCLLWLFLLLLVTPSVFSDVVGHNVNATAGDDVILPCHLDPPLDVTDQTVKWTLNGVTVHLYRDRADNPDDLQDEKFRGRTSLFPDELVKGNISLKLTNVHEDDAGFYSCYVPRLKSGVKTGNVFLIVYVSDVVGHEPVQVEVGDDVTLSCHLDPQLDVTDQTVEWTWNNRTVHRYRDRADNYEDQDEQFRDRTSMFHSEMTKGDISLKLTNVKKEDAGVYFCHVPNLQSQIKEGSVSLKVGGDPLDPVVTIFSVVIALSVVIFSAKIFFFIRLRNKGYQPDTVDIIRSVSSLVLIIAVSAVMFLYIRGDLLDPRVFFINIIIIIIIIIIITALNLVYFIVVLVAFFLYYREEELDTADIIISIIIIIIISVFTLLPFIAPLVALILFLRGDLLDPTVFIIIISVFSLLYFFALLVILFFYIRGRKLDTDDIFIIIYVLDALSMIAASAVMFLFTRLRIRGEEFDTTVVTIISVVGGLLLIAASAGIFFYIRRRIKRWRREKNNQEDDQQREQAEPVEMMPLAPVPE